MVSVDVTVSVDPAESIAAFESEKITALSNLFRCRTVIVVQCVWRAQLIQGYS